MNALLINNLNSCNIHKTLYPRFINSPKGGKQISLIHFETDFSLLQLVLILAIQCSQYQLISKMSNQLPNKLPPSIYIYISQFSLASFLLIPQVQLINYFPIIHRSIYLTNSRRFDKQLDVIKQIIIRRVLCIYYYVA